MEKNMTSVTQAIVLIGDTEEDNAGVTFKWAVPLHSKNVKAPRSYMLYAGASNLKKGTCEKVYLVSKGIGGLYNVLTVEQYEELKALAKFEDEEIEWTEVLEYQPRSGVNREEASNKARLGRLSRKGIASPETESNGAQEQPALN
jgi:hypothetical protein